MHASENSIEGADTPAAAGSDRGRSRSPDVTSASAETAQRPTRPQITGTGLGLAVVGWLLYTILYTLLIAQQQPDVPIVGLTIGQLIFSGIFATYSIPVWWLTVRGMARLHWGWTLATHVALAPFYAWLGLETHIGLLRTLVGDIAVRNIEANYVWILMSMVTVYAVQFTIYHLVESVKRLRWREQQAAELAAVAREQELAALKAQINPHFLFNTLNSISATVHTAPEQARNMIADLSTLLRSALRNTDRDHVPLREELRFATLYLDLESRRFSDRLQVESVVEVDEDELDLPVPPMILQPLAENAVKHGISPREDGGTITLSIRRRDDRLRVCIEDTGQGPDPEVPTSDDVLTSDDRVPEPDATGEATSGVGLANTNRRLKHAFGADAGLHTEPIDPHGFRVWFDLPAPSEAC